MHTSFDGPIVVRQTKLKMHAVKVCCCAAVVCLVRFLFPQNVRFDWIDVDIIRQPQASYIQQYNLRMYESILYHIQHVSGGVGVVGTSNRSYSSSQCPLLLLLTCVVVCDSLYEEGVRVGALALLVLYSRLPTSAQCQICIMARTYIYWVFVC